MLIQAPTGSGKTLAAFLLGIDRLNATPGDGLRLLYVSPLKALNYDIERNLRSPLAGLGSELAVGVRTGDTPAEERRRMLAHAAGHPDHHARVAVPAPHVAGARDAARDRDRDPGRGARRRRDEARRAPRALASSGSSGSSESPFQRVGLSATQRPLEEIGRFVAGVGREIELVDAGVRKELDLEVVVPVEDMRELGVDVRALRARPLADGVAAELRRRAVEPLDLAVRSTRRSSSSSGSTARPSCS